MSLEQPDERPQRPVIDHVGIEVADLDASIVFYDAIASRLGIRQIHRSASSVAYGKHSPVLWIVSRGRGPAPAFGHIALAAAGRPAVDAAYAAGLEHGGRDNGAPALRPHYHRNYYSAYLLDPDDYRVEVVTGSH
jgi:catechol 2,3-dioxygenase-like lactoylglutathione lyase family enzyme